MRVILSIACVAVVAAVGGSTATTQTLPIRSTATAKDDLKTLDRVSKQERAQAVQMKRVAKKVGAFRAITWNCQDALGIKRAHAAVSVWALPQSLAYRSWALEQWQQKASSCLKLQQQRTIPSTTDWVTAVKIVQRIYPGTSGWLLYISHREGGWGRFVMNHQGSGAGGWMQFMAGTYYAHNDAAFADARQRGFIVDESWNHWEHPLGQAITAGYMRYTHQDGCHWCL